MTRKQGIPKTSLLAHRYFPYVLLICIMCAAAGLRVAVAVQYGFYLDEFFAWLYGLEYWKNPSLASAMRSVSAVDVHPPGYYALTGTLLAFFGNSELVLRAPSILASIATIPVAFVIGSRFYDRATGLVAAAMLAFSWYPVIWGVYAKAYGLVMFLSLVAGGIWASVAQRILDGAEVPRSTILVYSLCITLLALLHYFGLMLVLIFAGGMAVPAIVARTRRITVFLKWFSAHGPVLLAYLCWLPNMTRQTGISLGYFEGDGSVAGIILFFARTAIWFLTGNSEPGAVFSASVIVAVLALLLWRILSSSNGWRRALRPSSATLFLCGWIIVPIIASIIVSVLLRPVLTYRNFGIILGPTLLLFSRALLVGLPDRKASLAVVVGVLVGMALLVVSNLDRRGLSATAVREVAHAVGETRSRFPDAPVLGGYYSWVFEYYRDALGPPFAHCSQMDLAAEGRRTAERYPVETHLKPDIIKFQKYLDAQRYVGSALFTSSAPRHPRELLDCIRACEGSHFWYLFGPRQWASSLRLLDARFERVETISEYGASAFLYRKPQHSPRRDTRNSGARPGGEGAH